MKLVGYMATYNEEEYIRYAIESTVEYLDKLIIIEGRWGESSGSNRSSDKTIEIIESLAKKYKNILLLCIT